MKYTDIVKIGIDHGYRNMKTRHCVFDSALSKLEGIPDDTDGILQYGDVTATLYGRRIASVDVHNKADSEEYYLLTLAALAKEMQARQMDSAVVCLSAGLPQKWYLTQKGAFADMLLREKHPEWVFEGRTYRAEIVNVRVYIQGYAAALPLIMQKYRTEMAAIVDIGGETVDIIPVTGTKIMREDCRIETRATIRLMKEMAERVSAELYEDIPESKVLEYLIRGPKERENVYEAVMHRAAEEYCGWIYRILKEYRLNPALVPVVFVGGGAGIIQRFGTGFYRNDMTDFLTDLRANAIGYEMLDEMYYSRK